MYFNKEMISKNYINQMKVPKKLVNLLAYYQDPFQFLH